MAVPSCSFSYAGLVQIQKDLSNQTRLNVIHTHFPFNKHLLKGLCYNFSLVSMMQSIRLLQISWRNQDVLVFGYERWASIIPFFSFHTYLLVYLLVYINNILAIRKYLF